MIPTQIGYSENHDADLQIDWTNMALNQSVPIHTHQFGVSADLLLIFLLLVSGNASTIAAAETIPSKIGKMSLDGPDLSETPTWSETLRAVLLTAIPDKFEDRSQWDKTRTIFDGLRVKQRGFDIRVSERRKTVNDGTWHKYQVELIDPARHLQFVIENIRSIGAGQFRFNIKLASKLRCRGDFEHWVLGVKGLNVTVVSEADIRITADCLLAFRVERNSKSLIPDILLEPRLNNLKIDLTGLEVRRIGEIRGDLAEGIGDGSRSFIETLLHSQEGRALKKANEALEKKRGSLRFSMARLW